MKMETAGGPGGNADLSGGNRGCPGTRAPRRRLQLRLRQPGGGVVAPAGNGMSLGAAVRCTWQEGLPQ